MDGSKRSLSVPKSSAAAKLNEPMNLETAQAEKQDDFAKVEEGENEFLGIYPEAIEKMTVQQLRSKLRSLGIAARGSKQELVSSLKNHLNRDINGERSMAAEDQGFSKEEKGTTQSNSKKKNKTRSSEDPVLSRTKKKVKQGFDEEQNIVVKAERFGAKQELSVTTTDMPGKKSIQSKRKTSSMVASTKITASELVDPSKNLDEPWTIFAHKKPQEGWIAYNPKTMRPPPLSGDTKHVKLISWNVNGLRSLLKLRNLCMRELAQREGFDVLCLQETKLQEKDVERIKEDLIEGYENSFWTCSISKLGYSGTAIISRIKPLSVRYGMGISDHDSEGRLVTLEFNNFFVLSGYVPNSGDGLRRLPYRITHWDSSLGNYVKDLEKSKPVILTGDLNCAHEEIDIYDPAGNKRSAGFTIEERESFEANFLNRGFVDTFRKQHPGVVGYTYWGYRHGGRKTNKGWRLDYFLVSESIAEKVHDSYILPDVVGSDHSPIGLIFKI